MIQVLGLPQLQARIARSQAQVEAAAPVAARSGGEVVARIMAAFAPRRTGRLAGSVRVEMDEDEAQVFADVDYDRFVQRGTRYMSAQPYGEQAAEVASPAVGTTMGRLFKVAVER